MDMRLATTPMREPPPRRDPVDAALIASRLLATAGRMQSRLRRVARRHRIDPRVFRFLLLFAECNGPIRVADVAENLGVSHQTASRIATRALTARFVYLINVSAVDGREVAVRLTGAGREATNLCLEALRADAAEVAMQLNPPQRTSSGAYGIRWYRRNGRPADEGWIRYDPE